MARSRRVPRLFWAAPTHDLALMRSSRPDAPRSPTLRGVSTMQLDGCFTSQNQCVRSPVSQVGRVVGERGRDLPEVRALFAASGKPMGLMVASPQEAKPDPVWLGPGSPT